MTREALDLWEAWGLKAVKETMDHWYEKVV